MYTIESLKSINGSYNQDHRVTQDDADVANMCVDIIQQSRSDDKIQAGDIVEIIDEYGNYYKNAHIEIYNAETDRWSVCEQPNIPFVYIYDNVNIKYNTSGGAWSSIPNNLNRIGKRTKVFNIWGHCDACRNGAFNFKAEVNVWEYKHNNPLYGEYTEKHWRKHYISYCVDKYGNPKDESGYRYFGDGIAFVTKADYNAWLKTYRAVEFDGGYPNQKIVFCYKEHSHIITKTDWNILDLPMDTRLCNGINLCKVKYDDENHCIDAYRFSNSGTLDYRKFKAYELARGNILQNILTNDNGGKIS